MAPQSVTFVKMQGAGNDYIYVDVLRQPDFPLARGGELARRWSDRHFGIGGDGLIALVRGERLPLRMAMWNADGSPGAMCGNGLRCLAVLAFEHGHVAGPELVLETPAGSSPVELLLQDGVAIGARVELGGARFADQPREFVAAGHTVRCHTGDTGNPHAVVFVDDPEAFPVAEVGSALQRHAAFPDGVNVEFVAVRADGSLRQRTFERGSGETLACGSGAAFAAAVARRLGLVTAARVPVDLRGGRLVVSWRDASLVIEGPARTVFRGEIELASPWTASP